MNLKFFILIITVSVLSACGGSKNVIANGKAFSVASVTASHKAANPDFKTLAARVQVVYEDDKKQQSITTSLRMEKDKTIWIKASILGITIAKVLITPNRVSYYETIGNTYFDGDFALLSDFVGTELNFEQTQAILLGQSIFDFSKGDFEGETLQTTYKLQPKKQSQAFIYSVLLNLSNYKVSQETVSQPADNRLLTVRYGDYQKIENYFYPSEISLQATEGDSKTKIDINYKSIDLNAAVSFPFDIPAGYEEIQLNK